MTTDEYRVPDNYEWVPNETLTVGYSSTLSRGYSVTTTLDPNRSREEQITEMRAELEAMKLGEQFIDGAGIELGHHRRRRLFRGVKTRRLAYCFYPIIPNRMKAWIAKLFRQEEHQEQEAPPMMSFRREGLRADLVMGRRCCAHLGYLVEFRRWNERDDEWQPVALFFDDELQAVRDLLSEAVEYRSRSLMISPEQLPG